MIDLWGTLIFRSGPQGVYHLDKKAGFGNSAGRQGTRPITQIGFLLSVRWDIFSLLALPFKKHLEDAEFPGNSYTAQSGQLFSPQVWLTQPRPWLLHLPFALSPFWLWAQTCHVGSLLPCFTLASFAILMRIFCSNLWYLISWTKPHPLVLLTLLFTTPKVRRMWLQMYAMT